MLIPGENGVYLQSASVNTNMRKPCLTEGEMIRAAAAAPESVS